MAWYSLKDIRIEGNYPLEVVSDMSMDIAVNQHGSLTYSGLVPIDVALKYVRQSSDKQLIKVYIKDELEFCGYPDEIITDWPNVGFDNSHCQLKMKLTTSSTFADIYPKERFYQDINRTFEDIISEALEDSGTGHLVAVRGKKAIDDVILQYRETDWQFALRMAGRLGAVLVPNVISEEPEFSLGVPKREVQEEKNEIVFNMGRNIAKFRDKYNESSKFRQRIKGHQGVSDFHNFLCYEMKSENRYKLGDSVDVGGKTLVVMRKTFVFEKGGIEEIYTLGHEQEFSVPFNHNKRIAGLELSGTVLERDGQRIKMLLDIDAERQSFDKTWFHYAPVTNNGMYSMPLEGESVMLQWQSEADHDTLIVRPARKNGTAMPHHGERHFLTEFDQHMMMVQGMVSYTNPVGSIQLLSDMGFNIPTNKNFALMAGQDIKIRSKAQVEVRSPERITLGKTDTPSSIDMISNSIHIAAKENVVQRSGVNDYKDARIPQREGTFEVSSATVARLCAPMVLGAFCDGFTNYQRQANGGTMIVRPSSLSPTKRPSNWTGQELVLLEHKIWLNGGTTRRLNNGNIRVTFDGIDGKVVVFTPEQFTYVTVGGRHGGKYPVISSSLLQYHFGFYAAHRFGTVWNFRTENEAIIAGGLSHLMSFNSPTPLDLNSHNTSNVIQGKLGQIYREGRFVLYRDLEFGGYAYSSEGEPLRGVEEIRTYNTTARGDVIENAIDGAWTITTLPEQVIYLLALVPSRTARTVGRIPPQNRVLMEYFYTLLLAMSEEEQESLRELFNIVVDDYNPWHMLSAMEQRRINRRNFEREMLDRAVVGLAIASVILSISLVILTKGAASPALIASVNTASTVVSVAGATASVGLVIMDAQDRSDSAAINRLITDIGINLLLRGATVVANRTITFVLPRIASTPTPSSVTIWSAAVRDTLLLADSVTGFSGRSPVVMSISDSVASFVRDHPVLTYQPTDEEIGRFFDIRIAEIIP